MLVSIVRGTRLGAAAPIDGAALAGVVWSWLVLGGVAGVGWF